MRKSTTILSAAVLAMTLVAAGPPPQANNSGGGSSTKASFTTLSPASQTIVEGDAAEFDGRVYWTNPGNVDVGIEDAPVALVSCDAEETTYDVATTDEDGYFSSSVALGVGEHLIQAVYDGRLVGNANEQYTASASACVHVTVEAADECPAASAYVEDILRGYPDLTLDERQAARMAVAHEVGKGNDGYFADRCAHDRDSVEAWLLEHGFLG
jgi:hypothetical protein